MYTIDKEYFLTDHCNNVLVQATICAEHDKKAKTKSQRAEEESQRAKEEILESIANQCFRTVSQNIYAYNKSLLPERFIRSQNFIVTNWLPSYVYGYYNPNGDTIYFDGDAIRGLSRFSSLFLFGQQLGYKIQHYKDEEPCYEIIRRECGIYNEQMQRTILSGIFGSLALKEYKADEFPIEEVAQMEDLSKFFNLIESKESETGGFHMEEVAKKRLVLSALNSVYRV